jgi:hypothetical protein
MGPKGVPGSNTDRTTDCRSQNQLNVLQRRDIGYTAGRVGQEISSSPQCPDVLWGTPSLLHNECQGIFRWGLSGRSMKLTNPLHLVPRLECWGYTPTHPYVAW